MSTQPSIRVHTKGGSPLGRINMSGRLPGHTGVPEHPMRVLGNFALVYILAGNGSYVDARGYNRKISAGDLILVFPDLPHWYGPPKGSVWDEFFVVFSGPVFDLWRSGGLLDAEKPVRHLEPIEYWLRRWEEALHPETDSLNQVCAFQCILAEALEASDAQHEPHWLAQARHLLELHRGDGEVVARELGMSYETFRKRFRLGAGVSPAYYQMTKQIDKACTLMLAGELTNKEIATRLNFCDEFHFSRRFKRVTGLTPTQFRLKTPSTKRTAGQYGA